MASVRARLGILALLVVTWVVGSGARAEDKCFTCHSSLGDKASGQFRQDVHRQKGVTCAGCHGGNAAVDEMDVAMNQKAGFLGVPKGDDVSARCAACHGDQARMKEFSSSLPTTQYVGLQQSVHGRLSITGKERIAQCTTCHRPHGIVPVKDKRSPVFSLNVSSLCASCHSNASFVRDYSPSLPVDQLEKYRTSVHGMRNAKGDPRAAECVSCHGSHNILSAKDVRSTVYPTNLPKTCSACHSDAAVMKEYGIPTDQYEKYAKSVHGVALLEKNDLGAPACNNCHGNHGATPPGVESISKVCGTCHTINADLFSQSSHKKAFDAMKLPECETCHGNHAIVAAGTSLLGVTKDAVCSRCHSVTERPKGFAAAAAMRRLMDSLQTSEEQAGKLVEEAEQKGMEVSEAKFKLRDARQARLEARTMVHSFDEARFEETAGKGLTISAVVTAEAGGAIEEFYFRRIGLGVATLIITIVVVSLYFLIRRVERRQRKAEALSKTPHA